MSALLLLFFSLVVNWVDARFDITITSIPVIIPREGSFPLECYYTTEQASFLFFELVNQDDRSITYGQSTNIVLAGSGFITNNFTVLNDPAYGDRYQMYAWLVDVRLQGRMGDLFNLRYKLVTKQLIVGTALYYPPTSNNTPASSQSTKDQILPGVSNPSTVGIIGFGGFLGGVALSMFCLCAQRPKFQRAPSKAKVVKRDVNLKQMAPAETCHQCHGVVVDVRTTGDKDREVSVTELSVTRSKHVPLSANENFKGWANTEDPVLPPLLFDDEVRFFGVQPGQEEQAEGVRRSNSCPDIFAMAEEDFELDPISGSFLSEPFTMSLADTNGITIDTASRAMCDTDDAVVPSPAESGDFWSTPQPVSSLARTMPSTLPSSLPSLPVLPLVSSQSSNTFPASFSSPSSDITKLLSLAQHVQEQTGSVPIPHLKQYSIPPPPNVPISNPPPPLSDEETYWIPVKVTPTNKRSFLDCFQNPPVPGTMPLSTSDLFPSGQSTPPLPNSIDYEHLLLQLLAQQQKQQQQLQTQSQQLRAQLEVQRRLQDLQQQRQHQQQHFSNPRHSHNFRLSSSSPPSSDDHSSSSPEHFSDAPASPMDSRGSSPDHEPHIDGWSPEGVPHRELDRLLLASPSAATGTTHPSPPLSLPSPMAKHQRGAAVGGRANHTVINVHQSSHSNSSSASSHTHAPHSHHPQPSPPPLGRPLSKSSTSVSSSTSFSSSASSQSASSAASVAGKPGPGTAPNAGGAGAGTNAANSPQNNINRRRKVIKDAKKLRKVFICQSAGCGDSFTTRFSLRRHMKRHTGEKPFQCDSCHKRFAEKSTLQRHTQIHTGEKPFKCTFGECPKAFADLANLKHHQRTTHKMAV